LKKAKKLEAVSKMIKEQLANNNKAVFRVISNSMEPLIRIGDRVVIEYTEIADLIPGDIILYFNGHRYCTHRLVNIFDDRKISKFITKGDNIQGFDLPFDEEKYFGRVHTIISKEKNIDLNTNRYRLQNKIIGNLITLHWLVLKAGNYLKNFFHIKSNIMTRLFSKITRLFFYWFNKSVDNIFFKDRIVKDK
jgi:signal peptidase I